MNFDSTLLLEIFTIFIACISLLIGLFVLLLPFITSRRQKNTRPEGRPSSPHSPSFPSPTVTLSQTASAFAITGKGPTISTKQTRIMQTDERNPVERDELLDIVSKAQQIQAYADTYRSKLGKDPSMSRLHILNMPWSNLLQVYVQLFLRPKAHISEEESALHDAQTTSHYHTILDTERRRIEQQRDTAIEPSEAIRIYKHCVVLGTPGTGKSTLLKYLALRCARRELRGLSDLPIYIDLNAFVQSSHFTQSYQSKQNTRTLGETFHAFLLFLAEQWRTYDFPQQDALDYLHNNLKGGNALVLLDGLGETLPGQLVDDANRVYEHLSQLINKLTHLYPEAFIVVSARTAWYEQHPPFTNFTELEVLPLCVNDIKRFVHNWFVYHNTDSAQHTLPSQHVLLATTEHVIDALLQPERQTMASNPLLLSLLVLIAQTQQELPGRRVVLYERCVEILRYLWKTSDDTHTSRWAGIGEGEQERLLEEIAWYAHSQGKYYVSRQELHSLITTFVAASSQHVEQIVAVLCSENGLLREQATGIYSFLHFTFQEYFAARAVRGHEERVTLLLKQGYVTWWKETLLFYTGLLTDASDVVEHFWEKAEREEKEGQTSLFHKNLLMASECLVVNQSVSHTYRSNVIHNLFRELTQTPTALIRRQTAEILARMGEQAVDGIYLVSGRSASETINRRLLDMLSKDDAINLTVKKCVAYALGLYSNGHVLNELTEMLANDMLDSDIRIHLTQALHKACQWPAVDKMIAIASDFVVDVDVRVHVVMALANLLNEAQRVRLVELLADRTMHIAVRCAIADVLSAEASSTIHYDVQAVYAQTNAKSEFALYWRLLITLASSGNYEHMQELFPILANNNYAIDVRLDIVSRLATLHFDGFVPDLFNLLDKKTIDWRVRVSILVVLEVLRGQSLYNSLLLLLKKKDLDIQVHNAALHVFEKIGKASSSLISSLRMSMESGNASMFF